MSTTTPTTPTTESQVEQTAEALSLSVEEYTALSNSNVNSFEYLKAYQSI